MKKIVVLLALFASLAAVAQTDSTKTKPVFKLSANYNSNLHYYGRTDSLKSSGFFPLAELWITPKFYVNAAPIFVNNTAQSFDYAGTVATIGYQNVSDKWISGIYALKPFYEAGSDLVQSALKAQTGVNISRLTKVVNFNIGADAKFSDNIDFGASAGLDHIFRIQNKDNSVIVLDPSIYVYCGTQRFSRTYTKRQNNGLPVPIGPGNNQQQVTENVNSFAILSYEASMPIIYAKGKWMVIATPAYVIPQNLLTVTNRPDLSEHGENMFYGTVGLKYTF
ncbi:MAG: hypothetical protein JWP69_1198 [Flaviaesturariibacter sp.]|nr:hypothetical protein [Flaviaesturariibacter sp.]